MFSPETAKPTTFSSLPCTMNRLETVSSDQVPYILREPSILTGYRLPNQSLMYYSKSLFQIHNETFNVWSHLIGCGIVIYKIIGYCNEFNIYTDYLLTTLLIVCIALFIELIASANYHLMHSKSPQVHYLVLMFDFMGCSFAGFGGGIYGLYGLSDPYFYQQMEDYFLLISVIITYANFLGMSISKLVWGHCHQSKKKKLVIGGLGIQAFYNALPYISTLSHCYVDPECSIIPLLNPVCTLMLFGLAAVLFAAHQPEKTWPGKFDILGHGHQIFHVVLIIVVVFQLDCIYNFHKAGLAEHSKPSFIGLLGLMAGIYIIEVLT